MSYIIYNTKTTRYLSNHPAVSTRMTHFKTLGSAKATLTREVKSTAKSRYPINVADFSIATQEDFAKIEKTETVISLMGGKVVTQSVNTPWCCNPSSETFWSM